MGSAFDFYTEGAYRVVYLDADGIARESYTDDPEEAEESIRDCGGIFILEEWCEPEELPGYEPPPPPEECL